MSSFTFDFSKPKVMSILNATPDSFFAGSRLNNESSVLKRIESDLTFGADCFDLGGVSTKPGSSKISYEEERSRIIPLVKSIVKEFPKITLSIDTFRINIAKEAVDLGASMINDVSFGQDKEMLRFCAENKLPYVLMHLRGTPNNMMSNTNYENVVTDVFQELQERIVYLRSLGMSQIIIDPGFGFSKTVEQNYQILRELKHFSWLNQPILVGISRKSMIWKVLESSPEEALNGTTALHMAALMNGANILRVHDVKEANECRKLYLAMRGK